jgi:hypothetical protein
VANGVQVVFDALDPRTLGGFWIEGNEFCLH